MKKKTKIFIIIGITICFSLVSSFTYGKYVYNAVYNYYLESKGFYFSSEDLGESAKNNVNTSWDGSDVEFSVTNSVNDTLISDYDIDYNVTCSIISDNKDKLDCNLMNSNSNIFTGVLSSSKKCINNSDSIDVSGLDELSCLRAGYSYSNIENVSLMYFNITSRDNSYEYKDVKVKIEVNSVSPYLKTLIGIYDLNKKVNEDKINLSYKSFTNYDRLIVSNSFSSDKVVTIRFNPDDYRVILNDSNVITTTDDNGYINSIISNISAFGSVSYMFEKITSNNTLVNDDFVYEYKDY